MAKSEKGRDATAPFQPGGAWRSRRAWRLEYGKKGNDFCLGLWGVTDKGRDLTMVPHGTPGTIRPFSVGSRS